MPGNESLMSLGVEDFGVNRVFGVPSVFYLGVPGKGSLWVPRKVFILSF